MKSKEIKEKVVTAFKNSQYKWRTARGISKDSQVTIQDVTEFLNDSDLIIKARKSNNKGQPLFALKEIYEAKTSLGKKILNAIINKNTE